jgi:hypothetical protein
MADCVAAPTAFSLEFRAEKKRATHCRSLLLTAAHCRSLLLTAHCRSLCN